MIRYRHQKVPQSALESPPKSDKKIRAILTKLWTCIPSIYPLVTPLWTYRYHSFRKPVFFLLMFLSIDLVEGAPSTTIPPKVDLLTLSSLLEKANNYYAATLFERAIPLYEGLFKSLEKGSEQRAQVRLRLARCYYFTQQFAKISDLLSELVNDPSSFPYSDHENTDSESLFLLGLTYNKLQKYELSARTFLTYLSPSNHQERPYHNECLFELGMAYFQQQKYSFAKKYWSLITPQPSKIKLYPLSQFYLARLAIKEHDYAAAEKILNALKKEIEGTEILPFAIAFLQGEIAFSKADWPQAIAFFEEASSKNKVPHPEWQEDALYYLGWSYLNASEGEGLEVGDKVILLNEAEHAFKNLIAVSPSDRAYLGLGHCYLSLCKYKEDKTQSVELEELLSDKNKFSSKEARHHALLLRTEVSPSYSERKKFFRQLTQESNQNDPNYPNGWYLSGLNEFDEGQKNVLEGKQQEAKKHLDLAINHLSKSFELLYPSNKNLAVLALKYEIETYCYYKTKEGYLKGLALLGKMLNQYRDDLFVLLEDPGEIYFLQGFTAFNLTQEEAGRTFFSIAESSLTHNIESYPKSDYYEESLRLLGILYYTKGDFEKAGKIFLSLAERHPPSPFTAEALFWAANCLDMTGGDRSKSNTFRSRLFEQYSDSPFAPEAMFRLYDFNEYLNGNPQTIPHLNLLLIRYPQSPFVITALFLKGLNDLKEGHASAEKEKKLMTAIGTFDQLESVFNQLYRNGVIPQKHLQYFTHVLYRSLMEKALVFLDLSESGNPQNETAYLQDAEQHLYKIYADLEDQDHPLTALLITEDAGTKLQEECSYHLARCYVMQGDDAAAARILEKRIENYQSAKITRGYYLSKMWFELGKIASRKLDYLSALQQFKNAEDAAKGKILRPDELLGLWIEQGQNHRFLGGMDEAMLIFSRVINYNAISPKRLEAMFLRAEIYEEQGRLELAKRQLEAVAAKGGKWAQKAKEKLEKNYVYQ